MPPAVAYFFPSIPVLVLQAVFNDSVDRRLGLALGAGMRLACGLGGLVVLTALFPHIATTHTTLLATTVLVGMSYGLAFGTSYQLASLFPRANTVALTTGTALVGVGGPGWVGDGRGGRGGEVRKRGGRTG